MNRRDQGERLARTDELLQEAGPVLQDAFAGLDSDALLERIARRAQRSGREPCESNASPGPSRHPSGTTVHRRAAEQLAALSSQVVSTTDAVDAMARFGNEPRTDPTGALPFACLLYLSDCVEGAQFWWQFAAGAGVSTAAYCLHLHHARYNETDMADFWLKQARYLHDHPGTAVPHGEQQHSRFPTPRAVFEATVALLPPAQGSWDSTLTDPAGSGHFLSWALHHAKIADAVLRLATSADDDYGPVPRPDPALAVELEEHLEHSH
ncbi:hypothetical protein [Streptomyces tsukubensis]|uniref:hypothetical protein n=1 Tax=Streptomyces tsukubensis TaxID=83656 RepID=UPI00344DEFAC